MLNIDFFFFLPRYLLCTKTPVTGLCVSQKVYFISKRQALDSPRLRNCRISVSSGFTFLNVKFLPEFYHLEDEIAVLSLGRRLHISCSSYSTRIMISKALSQNRLKSF